MRGKVANEISLRCEYCTGWFHIDCQGINKDVFDFLSKQGKQLHWFCKDCNAKAVDVLKLVKGMKAIQDDMKAAIVKLDNRID